MTFVILIAVWIVIGLLLGMLATSIWKEPRPYGDAADFIAAVSASVITGIIDWLIFPFFNIEGWLKFAGFILEPTLVALIVLWVIRKIKRSNQ
jgi:uncharacterized membrane protein YeaQ/YmgE (transglycosylase-associated protein family)